jgi:hypothetical protein
MSYPSLKQIALQIKTLFRLHAVNDYKKIRVGSDYDGGYVMLDDFVNISLAISGGVGGNDDWERALARKTKVIAFDITDDQILNRTYEFRNEKLTSLNSLLESFPNYSVIGKIDIEGGEFETFKNTEFNFLKKFRQLVLEIHLEKAILSQIQLDMFTKLNSVFNTIHIHGNNTAEVFTLNGIKVPKVFEITLANKDYYTYSEFVGRLPCELDRPSDPTKDEIELFSS